MEPSPPENYLDVRHERPDAVSTGCAIFSCCRGSGAQFSPSCVKSCFHSNHRVEPVIFAPTDDVYLDLKPARRIRVIYKTGSNKIQAHTNNGDVLKNPNSHLISESDSEEDEDYWFENVSPRRPAIEPPPQKKHAPKRIFHKFEPQERPKFDMKASQPDACASLGSSGGRLPRKTIKTDAILDDDDEDDGEDHDKREQLGLNKISRRITFDQNAGTLQEPANIKSSCVSTPRDNGEEGSVELTSSSSASGGSGVTTLHVVSAIENTSDLILNITADSTKVELFQSQNHQRSRSTSPVITLPHHEMTSPDADGKTVINIPDPGESCTDGPSPTPVSNEEDRIGGSEEGTTTIIVSGGHLGGVANVGFESDEEEENECSKNQLPDDNVDGIDITNTIDEQASLSVTSPSNIQPEIVTYSEGQTHSSSSTNSNSTASHDDSVDVEHSADAGYKRIRDLPEAISIAIGEEERSDGENKPMSSENHTDPLRRDVQQNGTLPSDNEPQQTTTVDVNNNRPLLFFIHGVGGSADSWITQLSYFSDSLGYECVATDLLGHGFSSSPDRPKSYTFKKLLRDTFTVFDHFTATSSMNMASSSGDALEGCGFEPRSCVVIGHSYGCALAVSLARQRPDNVKLLIMVASGGPTPLTPPTGIDALPPSLATCCLKPFLKCGQFLKQQKSKAAGNINGDNSNMAKTSAAASVAARRGNNNYFKNTLDIPSYVLHHILMGQYWPEGDASYYRRVSIPTLLVYGLKDPFVSLVEMCEMERTIPKSYLELIPLAGHEVMQDQPKSLNVMMRKFIEKYV